MLSSNFLASFSTIVFPNGLVGKPIKKDKKKGKSTLIHLLGYKNTINYADKLQKKILLKLKKHGKNANELKKTVKFILERSF